VERTPDRNDAVGRIAIVLSAGGLRGAAHIGVLRQLIRNGVAVDALVGVSAGAIVAAYYAAVGLSLDDLIHDAEIFRGRHLLAYSLNVQSSGRFARAIESWCGVIPNRLRQLESATFERLHHGVQQLGIVCHDTRARRPRYFTATLNRGPGLSDLVRASASIPYLFPAVAVICQGDEWRLTDGGLSDPVPLAFARGVISATHVIVSDCRWLGRVPAVDSTTVWIRPRMAHTGTLWSPRRGLLESIAAGEAAVTDDVLKRIRGWFSPPRLTRPSRSAAALPTELTV
jgi:predicted acylesterase/phospholipase RssA